MEMDGHKNAWINTDVDYNRIGVDKEVEETSMYFNI